MEIVIIEEGINKNVQPHKTNRNSLTSMSAILRPSALRLQLPPRDQYHIPHSAPLTNKNANLKLSDEDITTTLKVGDKLL